MGLKEKLMRALDGAKDRGYGPWKPMPPAIKALYQKYLADIHPILDEKRKIDGQIKKLESKLMAFHTEFGVDMRALLPEGENEADGINMNHEDFTYRCTTAKSVEEQIDERDEKRKRREAAGEDEDHSDHGHGVITMGVGNADGVEFMGEKPPKWVAEAIMKAMQEAVESEDGDGPKTIQ